MPRELTGSVPLHRSVTYAESHRTSSQIGVDEPMLPVWIPAPRWHLLTFCNSAGDGNINEEDKRGMTRRILKVVKLTPIALSFCECCKAEFRSTRPVEDDAEAEMKKAFETHTCNPAEND